ncbi:MAG: integrase core domain-containing protein [Rhodoferax sp.]
MYKHVYASVTDARTLIARHIDWYNTERPHSSLEDQTPNDAYCASLPKSAEAA